MGRRIRPTVEGGWLLPVACSCAAHTAAFLLLACLTLAGGQASTQLLRIAWSDRPDDHSLLVDFSLLTPDDAAPDGWDSDAGNSPSALEAASQLESAEPDVSRMAESFLASSAAADTLTSSTRQGVAQLQQVGGGRGPARGEREQAFFGIQIVGERFVFVVDSSSSMQGRRWESACGELLRSLKELGPGQQFYLVCFDKLTKPYRGETPRYLRSTQQQMRQVRSWLRQLELGHNTLPRGAVELALAMEPDAIFLLSDGEFRDDTLDWLRHVNGYLDPGRRVIPIHTVSLLSQEGRWTLQCIAAENHGTFVAID
jgi:hypothetical protein